MKSHLACVKCGASPEKPEIKKTFLGFPKFTCSHCKLPNLHPASKGMVILYWILATIFVVLFGLALASGTLLMPGIIFIAGFWGLITQRRLVKEHEHWQRLRSRAEANEQ